MVPYAELEKFFSDLVAEAQRRGIPCAITSGMACVRYGVAATTKDCDVLCGPESSDDFRNLISTTELRGLLPNYRGNISPPLDARWMRGGWTSHFTWKTPGEDTCLDIFGIAPRGSSPWEEEIHGLYASRHIVAEMKRTSRSKDWPFINALAIKLLKRGDARGILHLYDADALRQYVEAGPPSPLLLKIRPVLRLAIDYDPMLAPAVHAETVFGSIWTHAASSSTNGRCVLTSAQFGRRSADNLCHFTRHTKSVWNAPTGISWFRPSAPMVSGIW